MKRTKQVKKVKRPHREGGDNDAAWLKADNTVHSLPLPPNLSLPRSLLDTKTLSLYLTVHRRRPITHMPSHSLPHTHAQLDTRLLWVGHFSMPFCLLPPLRPRFRLLSSLSPSILFVSDICFCGFFYYERVSTCPPCCCSCFCSLSCCCCFCCLFSTETLQNCRLMHNLLQL